MVFSSPLFIFLFLPIILMLVLLVPGKWKNRVLLAASLFFYTWGETKYVVLMVVSILLNYFIGLLIDQSSEEKKRKIILAAGVGINLLLLVFFKYANFLVDNFNLLGGLASIEPIKIPGIHLPIGISFFTFQALSYTVDVYRKETPVQKSLPDLALYISLFPQLIAGPIVRYHDVAEQLKSRTITLDKFSSGVERFILGMAKKVLLANNFAYVADQVFDLPASNLGMDISWLAIICYSLQIYFDFSGYSDMAIGLGRMFGFEFLENFNYPYIARNIQDFWRRWHISLSSWFRDYLYIPLGGSRVNPTRLYINLITVFLLTGLWHGASWNFVIWGLFHGLFLIMERGGLSKIIDRLPKVVGHIYTLLVVIVAWVFFRAETLEQSGSFIAAMFSFESNLFSQSQMSVLLNNELYLALAGGLIFATPIRKKLVSITSSNITQLSYQLGLITLFLTSVMYLAANTYNPFIYFRF